MPRKGSPRRGCALLFAASLLVFAATAACSGGGDPGPVILRVNDVPITLRDFEKEYYFRRAFTPIVEEGQKTAPNELTADELKARVINGSLIPFAAVQRAYQAKIPRMIEKAEEIRAQVRPDATNFAALAAEHSTPSTAASRGRLGFFGRGTPLPYPLPQKAFSMKVGEISEPFFSMVGCHILYIESRVAGSAEHQDRVEAHHILLAYEDDPEFVQKTIPELVAQARVEVVDPAFEPLAGRK